MSALEGINFENGSLIASWPIEGVQVEAGNNSINPLVGLKDLRFKYNMEIQSSQKSSWEQ